MDDITEKGICSRQVDKTDYSGKLGQSSSSLILDPTILIKRIPEHLV